MTATITMRRSCICGALTGRVEERNGQDCVFCGECGRYQYNAPRTETGREQRSLRSRPSIPPSKRARILERDNYTCVLCHHVDVPLSVGHLISVESGQDLGLADVDLYDDENLAAMCAECNSGQSKTPVSLRFLAYVLQARLAFQRGRT